MTPSKGSRGRPKGTGLNDAAQLRAIAGLIAADPELKPTTAIKKLGINDPSIIRRLRDKFHAMEPQLIAELRTAAAPIHVLAQLQTPAPIAADSASARVVTLASAREIKKTQPVAQIDPAVITAAAQAKQKAPVEAAPPVSATIETLPVRARRAPGFTPPSETELPSWIGVGLSLFVFGFEAQYAMFGTMFQCPQLMDVVKSQAAFTETAVAMSRSMFASGSSS